MKILDTIKSFFTGSPTFGLGAFDSPVDHRIVSTAEFQAPVSLPAQYRTDMPGVENQGSKPICVGEAFAKLIELYFQNQGITIDVSEDDLYDQCKAIDGIPDQDGTYPVMGAKVSVAGVASKLAYATGDQKTIVASRTSIKVSGYAKVPLTFDAICQAIFQNKAVAASVAVDGNWFVGKIMRVLQSIGRHMIVLHGFDTTNGNLFYGQNSWGIAWIGYIAGVFSSSVKPGHFQVKWDDINDTIAEVYALAKIPQELIDKAKALEYRFTSDINFGDQSYDVTKLQDRLRKEGFFTQTSTGYYGPVTAEAVLAYQKAHGILTGNGKTVGPLTRAAFNAGKTVSLIPLLAKAIQNHEGYFDGSRSFRNCSPANFKLASSTVSQYMVKLGAIGVDAQNFVRFPDYQTGFNALCTFLQDAATGRLSSYNGDMAIYTGNAQDKGFLDVYAPGIENNTLAYAQSIAKQLGVPYTTKLKDLI